MRTLRTLLATAIVALALGGTAQACTTESTYWIPLDPGDAAMTDTADAFHGPFTEVRAGVGGDNIDKFTTTDGIFTWGTDPWVVRVVLYPDHYRVRNLGTTLFWAKAFYCVP